MNKINDLGKDSVSRLVLRLAIPAMAAQLVNVLYSIIDRIYIGNIPVTGETALAGVGVCGPIVTLLSSFGTLIGLGGSILLSMRLGAGKKEEAKQIMSNSFLMLIITSIVLTCLFLLSKNKLLMMFGASTTTFSYANTYMTIYTIGTFFALMALGLNYFITCQGFAASGMLTVVIGAVCNIVLDYIFIFKLSFGVAGAAWATVIAQMLSCLYAITFLMRKSIPVHLSFGHYNLSIMKKIVSLGLSPFLILASDSLIIIVMNSMLQHFGGPGEGDLLISAATIIQSFFLLITGPLAGITGGTQTIISFNFGAKSTDRVKKAEKCIVIMSLIFTATMFIISRTLETFFVDLFTDNSEVYKLSVWGIKVFTLAVIPLAIQYSLVDCLTALGRTKTALALAVFRKGSYTALIILFPILSSASNAFYAESVADILSASVTTVVFLLVFKAHLKKREMGWDL